MNANYSASNPIFRDQPLSETHAVSPSGSSLREACRETSDYVDATLRAFLVLCMVTALLICGWNVGAWQNANVRAAQPIAAAQDFRANTPRTF